MANDGREEIFYVYMVASRNRRALYIGVTNDVARRTWEHKIDLVEGFSKRYRCHDLVYYEEWGSIADAIAREKQLKRWRRSKKDWLIGTINPKSEDLAQQWVG